METEILKHNIAGELAGLYVNYLAKYAVRPKEDYFKNNWISEYNSRITLMNENPSLVEKLNGFNEFYNAIINQSATQKRSFFYQPK